MPYIENYTQLQMSYYRLIKPPPTTIDIEYIRQRIKDLKLISQSPFHKEKYEKFITIK